MRGIQPLKVVNDNLQTISLPSLSRPSSGKPSEPKTQELAQWGICVYAYSLIAHMQKILAGLVQLAEAENSAACAPVSRHVCEWAALTCSVSVSLRDDFKQGDWEQAWQLLTKVALGSHWMRRYGGKYAGDPAKTIPFEISDPIYIPEAVKEYERYQAQNSREAEARDSYSFLCDHAHANAACLLRYHEYENNGVVLRFVDPDHDPHEESFLPFVNCCLIDLLTFTYELLGLANENTIRPTLLVVLKELARLAPPHLTGSVPA